MTLKNLRLERGLTQRQFADKLGIYVTTYNRIERGKQRMTQHMKLAMSAVLKVDAEKITIK